MQFDLDAGIGDAPQRDEDADDDPCGQEQGVAKPGECGEHVPGDRVLHRTHQGHPRQQHNDSGGHQRGRILAGDQVSRHRDQGRDPRAEHALEEQRGPDPVQQPAQSVDHARRHGSQDAGQPGSAEQHGDAECEARRPRGREPARVGVGPFGQLVHSLVSLVDCDATGGYPLNESIEFGQPAVVSGPGPDRPHDGDRRSVCGR
ncbi:Uncharacterised protein [Mycobacterium tuberculosis]|uniref:Uncharacterized protein n=1 Tax=Mycobacterium tuberculosis TaxID=1773 RepID=A0A655EVG4_MYCTX|nr:Uncharacterised protein [Mycobacterium tuberculosis]CKR68086.1 Uncharacterised protein [Mycobacterium tuberculosis]CKR79745.1 Uncharacterised protein [Mycobacterium tuberculosis]CKS03192.1 Uncharacterised protein [Mycobacterium tuberculosis]CKS65912.1 Uncharacterised protein [Mycobacterium tuberculosis]